MGDFGQSAIDESKRFGHKLTGGIFRKPKTPPLTAQELELERRQRKELDELTREENERLKAIKRGQRGRRSLLGSNVQASGGGGRSRSGSSGARPRGRAGGPGGIVGGSVASILGSGQRGRGGP